MTKNVPSTELELAELIISPVLEKSSVELQADTAASVRYRVRKHFGWRLSSIVLSRRALTHLLADPQRDVKIEYLQRELERSLAARREFRYPHFEQRGTETAHHYPLAMLP